ncbi:MAG: HD domain-containing phosphohydrolase [bacterium]
MTNNSEIFILMVDDESSIRRLVAQIMMGKGYSCVQAASGAEALDLLLTQEFSLLITDIMMPEMSGIELLSVAHKLQPDMAVIMLTGVDDQETAVQALEQGAYGYIIKPFQPNELLINVINALRRRELEKIRNNFEKDLQEQVLERTRDIRKREEEITIHLVMASEYRDEETGSHIRRIALYATALAKALGWKEDQVDLLRLAAPMHDIGKIGIPDHILLKSGKFTPDEFEIMKKHTVMGAGILSGSDVPLMIMASEVALNHHERWDGRGYPNGLSGENIPECARIVAIADVYDALLTDRVYRPAFPEAEAFPMMIAESGHHFDPRIFQCMCDIHEEFRQIRRDSANK